MSVVNVEASTVELNSAANALRIITRKGTPEEPPLPLDRIVGLKTDECTTVIIAIRLGTSPSVVRVGIPTANVPSYINNSDLMRLGASLPHGHRHVVVIVNPMAGRGKAAEIAGPFVRTLQEDCGMNLTVKFTERGRHAEEIAEAIPDDVEGIITVGGDGTLHEAVNGLAATAHRRKNGLGSVWFAPIATGSGNALAGVLKYQQWPATLLAVCRGSTMYMDSFRYTCGGVTRVGFLNVLYGIICDIDHYSEPLRFLGSLRFDVWALYEVLRHRGFQYTSRMRMLCPVETPNRTPCPGIECHECMASANHHLTAEVHQAGASHIRGNHLRTHSNYTSCNASSGGVSSSSASLSLSSADAADRMNDFSLEEMHTPPASPAQQFEWRTVEDTVHFFSLQNISLLTDRCHVAPFAHVADGLMDVVYIPGSRKPTRFQIARTLLGLDSGSHVHMPQVEYTKCKSFVLEPLHSHDIGTLGVDGEHETMGNMEVTVDPSSLRMLVLSRGSSPAASKAAFDATRRTKLDAVLLVAKLSVLVCLVGLALRYVIATFMPFTLV